MKVSYDSHTDSLTVLLPYDVPVAGSDEDEPGVVLDCEKQDGLAIEILDASRRVTDARRIGYQATG